MFTVLNERCISDVCVKGDGERKEGAQGGCQAKEGQHEGHTGHLLYMAILSDGENIVFFPLLTVQCISFVGVFLARMR